MSDIMARFKGCATADVRSGRVPNPELGKAAYLINSVRMKDSTRPGSTNYRVEIGMTALWPVAAGEDADGVEKGPDAAGTKVAHCIFSGDYFASGMKEFILKCLGMEVSDELQILEYLKAQPMCAGKFDNMDELTQINTMWEVILPAMVCALEFDGSAKDSGIFDGQVVLEIATTEKKYNKKVDNKGPDDESNWVFDRDGNPVTNVWRNTYLNRKIDKEEVRSSLGDEGIARFFGSVERFEELNI